MGRINLTNDLTKALAWSLHGHHGHRGHHVRHLVAGATRGHRVDESKQSREGRHLDRDGHPAGGGRGNLYVVCRVEIPTRLSSKKRALLEEFAGRTEGDSKKKKKKQKKKRGLFG